VVREFARQLDGWHTTLPQPLRWSLSDQFDTPKPESPLQQHEDADALDVFVSTQELREQAYGILKAQLRTRFY
jgi:hypothetical protein